MRIGVAKEIKSDEYRVALTPAGALELAQRGHEVLVEDGAGEGSAFPNEAYLAAGAQVVSVDDVCGGGIVGYNAALVAVGMKADVWVLDKSVERMRELETMLGGRITLAMSTKLELEQAIAGADLVVGAVLIPGARAPKLITREMLALMKQGSVIVDVAIDQGGCTETSRPTTHSDPIYVVDGIVHYCVANMPGAVPITSTKALTNVTLPYVEAIAEHGLGGAV